MSSINKIESTIKEKMLNHQPTLDMDAMWDKVSTGVQPPKKKRRFIFWWFLGAVVGLSALGIFLNSVMDTVGSTTQPVNISSIDTEINSLKADQGSNENYDYSPKSMSNVTPITGAMKTENEIVSDSQIIEKESSSKAKDVVFESITESNSMSATFLKDVVVDLDKKDNSISALDKLKIKNYALMYSRSKIEINNFIAPPSKLSHPIKKRKSSFSLSGGYYINSRQFDLNDNELIEDFNQRGLTEKPIDAFSISLKYIQPLNAKFSLSGGIKYQSVWESNEYEDESTSYEIMNVLVERIYTSEGVFEVFEDKLIGTTTKTYQKRFNEFKSIALPIEVLYHSSIGKMNLEFGGGVDVVISRSQLGTFYKQDHYYVMENDTDQLMNTNLGISINMSAGVVFPIGEKFNLVSKLRGIIPLNNLYNKQYGITHKQSLLGLDMGINYSF
jgi:hypothetical protein